MKKTKILAMTLAAATMLMGAGYAYWTDALVINNTVETGKLNVRFVEGNNMTRGGDDQKGVGNPGYFKAYVKHENRNGGPKTEIENNGKTVTTRVENLYPGAYAQYYGEIENDGSIPAVFDNAEVDFTGKNGNVILSANEQKLKENLKFAFGYKIIDVSGNLIDPNPKSGDGRYYASGPISDMQQKINNLLTNVRLEPGQKLSLDFPSEEIAIEAMESINYPYNDEMHCITYTLDPNADDDIELQELGIHITINWKQHNAPSTQPVD